MESSPCHGLPWAISTLICSQSSSLSSPSSSMSLMWSITIAICTIVLSIIIMIMAIPVDASFEALLCRQLPGHCPPSSSHTVSKSYRQQFVGFDADVCFDLDVILHLTHACNLLTTKVQDTGHLAIGVIRLDCIIPRSRNDDHSGITLITGALSTLVPRQPAQDVWVLLRNYCGLRGRGGHSVVDSIEKLGDLRIARGGFKERIMGPVTTAPLAMADCCISSGCLAVCLVGKFQEKCGESICNLVSSDFRQN